MCDVGTICMWTMLDPGIVGEVGGAIGWFLRYRVLVPAMVDNDHRSN